MNSVYNEQFLGLMGLYNRLGSAWLRRQVIEDDTDTKIELLQCHLPDVTQ